MKKLTSWLLENEPSVTERDSLKVSFLLVFGNELAAREELAQQLLKKRTQNGHITIVGGAR